MAYPVIVDCFFVVSRVPIKSLKCSEYTFIGIDNDSYLRNESRFSLKHKRFFTGEVFYHPNGEISVVSANTYDSVLVVKAAVRKMLVNNLVMLQARVIALQNEIEADYRRAGHWCMTYSHDYADWIAVTQRYNLGQLAQNILIGDYFKIPGAIIEVFKPEMREMIIRAIKFNYYNKYESVKDHLRQLDERIYSEVIEITKVALGDLACLIFLGSPVRFIGQLIRYPCSQITPTMDDPVFIDDLGEIRPTNSIKTALRYACPAKQRAYEILMILRGIYMRTTEPTQELDDDNLRLLAYLTNYIMHQAISYDLPIAEVRINLADYLQPRGVLSKKHPAYQHELGHPIPKDKYGYHTVTMRELLADEDHKNLLQNEIYVVYNPVYSTQVQAQLNPDKANFIYQTVQLVGSSYPLEIEYNLLDNLEKVVQDEAKLKDVKLYEYPRISKSGLDLACAHSDLTPFFTNESTGCRKDPRFLKKPKKFNSSIKCIRHKQHED